MTDKKLNIQVAGKMEKNVVPIKKHKANLTKAEYEALIRGARAKKAEKTDS